MNGELQITPQSIEPATRWKWPMKRVALVIAITAVVVAGGRVWLFAAPTIDSVGAAPAYVVINTPTPVLFTARIFDTSVIPTGVNLLTTDANGVTIANLGRLYDDGTNGDIVANDKTFSRRLTLNESAIGQAHYRASAAFRGVLRRTLSSVFVVHVDPFPLPPDPGEAGKETLEGIDSDQDGIRDDVQRYIAITYLDAPRIRAALNQYAIAINRVLVAPDGDTASLAAASTDTVNAIRCIAYVVGPRNVRTYDVTLKALHLNTPTRSRAFLQAGRPGLVQPDDPVDLRQFCSVNVDAL